MYTPCFEAPDVWLSPLKANVEKAKQGCARCPVKQKCLADCLAYEELSGQPMIGVQGGLTPAERINLPKEKIA